MEFGFQILAVILAVAAAYFYWSGNSDGFLVAGIFAGCSFFISYRFRIKSRLEEQKADSDGFADDET